MKGRRLRWIAGLFAATGALAACHLFLDPDELTSAPRDAGRDTSVPDASVLSTWDGAVPACLPPLPLGQQPIVIVSGPIGAGTSCPPGYEPTGQRAYGNIAGGESACDAGSCQCGSVNVAGFCDDLRLLYFDEDTCADAAVSERPFIDATDGGCDHVDLADASAYATIRGTLRAASNPGCPPSGTADDGKRPASAQLEVQLCRPAPPSPEAAAPAACPNNGVSVPAATNAAACYASTTPDCAAGYEGRYSFALAPDLDDTRSCACDCEFHGTECTPGQFRSGTTSCASSAQPSTCRTSENFGIGGFRVEKPLADASTSSCTPFATPNGGVDFKTDQRLTMCCVSTF